VTPQEQFGAEVRRLRTAAGLSQMELGARADVHFTEVSRIEREARDVQLSTIVKLARGLGITPLELLTAIR
jgi:transcriptional regulator with XRE-family HTH domain